MLLADTHVLIEFLRGDPRLAGPVRNLIEEAFAQAELAVSAMSVVEAVRLHEAGKVSLGLESQEWAATQIRGGLHVVPVDTRIAALAPQLPREGFHTDPADQMIVATTILVGCPLVTGDRQIITWSEQTGRIQFVDARG